MRSSEAEGGRLCSVGRPNEGDTKLQMRWKERAQASPRRTRGPAVSASAHRASSLPTGALALHMPVSAPLFCKRRISLNRQKRKETEGESQSSSFPKQEGF